MSTKGTLEVNPYRPRLLLATGTVVLLVAIGLGWWQATDPAPLATSDDVVSATTPVGTAVYVGVVPADPSSRRILHLSGVKIRATSNTDQVSITPLLCRDGQVGVTTDPSLFCDEVLNPEDRTFVAGDSILIEVSSEVAAVTVIDQVRLAFRENLSWGTRLAGASAVVTVIEP